MQIVECVPNFSEGRDDTVIGAIAAAISSVASVRLLDVDRGWGANRTVMTFAGEPPAVLQAAFEGIRAATGLIDMRRHSGAHSRLGATDVCPFVPLQDADLVLCAALAQELGRRVADELDLPVFLYEAAARVASRKALPDVRRGEYEGLSTRFNQPGSEPDFGRPVFNEGAGATIIGARPILVAYNINLNTKSTKIASQIAGAVRESGRLVRSKSVGDASGNEPSELKRQPGILKACRAVGWYVEEYDCAQVTTNLLDFRITSLHDVFDEVSKQAGLFGVEAVSSESIGLIPLEAMLKAGRHYAKLSGRSVADERELIETAVRSLGLASVKSFDPQQKILEYRMADCGMPIAIQT